MRYYTVGTDDGSVAYRDAWHHADVIAQPHIVADDDWSFAEEFTLSGRDIHLLTCGLSVAVVRDKNIGTGEQVVTNANAVDGCDMTVVANRTSISNCNRGLVVNAVV